MPDRRPPRPSAGSLRQRSGISLIEIVVSLTLTSLMMIPLVGLSRVSHRVLETTEDRQQAGYAVDEAAALLADAVSITRFNANSVQVLLADGRSGQLDFDRGSLNWTVSGSATEVVMRGLTSAQFSRVVAANPSAGELVKLEISWQGKTAATASWASTVVWIRPTI